MGIVFGVYMWKYYQLADSRGVTGHYLVKGDKIYSYRPGRFKKAGIPDLLRLESVGPKVLLIIKRQNSPVIFEDEYIKPVMKYVQVELLLEG